MIQGSIIIIETVLLVTEIEEIVINSYANITAESLGLVPKGQKRYTTWERRGKPEGIMIERKEKLIEDIKGIYSPEEITEIFKIPDELINGFLYYVADNGGLGAAINKAEPETIKFILSNMAVKFLKLQKD